MAFLAKRTLLLAIVGLFACGGGGSYQGGTFSDAEARYAIGQPDADWERLDIGGDNDLAFSHEASNAVIQVNATCDPSMDAPLSALRNHLLIGWTEREVQSEELIEVDAREALRTHLLAKLDGVPREMVLTVLKKDECVYDFAMVAPPGSAFAQARPTYDRVIAGFHTD